jgi:hypothetical protein
MTEQWIISSDNKSSTVAGRSRVPFLTKCNPLFWFKNSYEQTLDQAPWYESGLPQAQRETDWNNRNPAQNLRAVVLGVGDKNYNVSGKSPIMTVQRNDLQPPELGWQWCVLSGGDLLFPRFFVCHCGKWITWYFGWQATGFFGAKIVPA